MAKVEMSLNEYNAMRDEMMLYKSLLTALLTPANDQYFYEHLINGDYDNISLSNDTSDLTEYQKNLMRNIVKDNLSERYKELVLSEDYIISDTYGMFRMDLCNITRQKNEEVENEPF